MDLVALQQQHTLVLWAAFAIAAAFGYIAQRSHFCTMGAISDIFNMGDWTRMRMWAMAVGVAMIGFHAMGWAGWIDPSKTFYTSGRVVWLSALVGGAMFGSGMVLASGCGSKTLLRMGAGSLKAVVVFCVMGIAAFATLRGVFGVLRVNTLDTVVLNLEPSSAFPVWIANALGWPVPTTGLFLALLVGGALLVWALSDARAREGGHLLGGLGLGVAIVAMWWVTGHLGYVPEHPQTLEPAFLATQSGRMEAMSFVAPVAGALDWLMFFSDSSKTLTTGVVAVAGVVVGAFVQSWVGNSFHLEGFRNTQDTALHLLGAVLMGVGGVTALGCTIGQGMSGLSTLSLTSLFAVLGIVLGAVAGLRLQVRLLESD